MPRKTQKDKVIEAVYLNATSNLIDTNTSDESETDEIALHLISDLHTVESFRFGDFRKVPKQKNWLTEVLPNYDEERFKEVTRVTFEQFDTIYDIVKDHDVFKNSCRQTNVSVQLAMTLYRLGSSGTRGSIADIARLFAVGDGSSITRITRRVFEAILDVEERYIFWPSKKERDENILPDTSKNLPKCVGFIDGTRIELDEAPHIDKEVYFDKESNYSLQLQLISDHVKRIRNYVVGYPASCHDSRVWNECNMSKHPDLYFSRGEWLCADKGYGLSKLLITPFRVNSPEVAQKDGKWFNKYFSSNRVVIEHVNGILKAIFPSLKKLKVKINDANAHCYAMEWIRVCLILYNITWPLRCEEEDNNGNIVQDYERGQEENELEEEDDNQVDDDDFDASDKRMALFYFLKEKLGK